MLLSAVQILNTLNQAPIALLNLSPQAQPALDLPIHLLYSLWLPLIQAFLYAVLIGWTLSHPRVMSHTRHTSLVALTAIILGLWLLFGQVLSSEHANMPYSLSTAYPLVGSFFDPNSSNLIDSDHIPFIGTLVLIQAFAFIRLTHLFKPHDLS